MLVSFVIAIGLRPERVRPQLDARPAEAYAEGHISNAVHLGADEVDDPSAHVNGARLPQTAIATMLGERGIDRDTKVVLYDDQGGFHAARLFWMLEYFGHQNVAVLNGGFPKWQAEGREVTTEVPTVEPKTFALTLSPRKEATADWLKRRSPDARDQGKGRESVNCRGDDALDNLTFQDADPYASPGIAWGGPRSVSI